MAFGEIWTARTIAAVIIGLTIMGIAFLGVIQGLHGIKDHRTEMDARRVAGMLEAVDHKPGTVARLNFAQGYDIELTEEHVTLRGPASPKRHMVNLHNLQEETLPMTVSEAKHVCISHDGEQVSLSKDCSIPSDVNLERDNEQVNNNNDEPPQLQGITVYNSPVEAGKAVVVKANQDTRDADDEIDRYEWDFDGDGTSDRTITRVTTGEKKLGQTEYTYEETGKKTISLTMYDAGGNEVAAEGAVTVQSSVDTPEGYRILEAEMSESQSVNGRVNLNIVVRNLQDSARNWAIRAYGLYDDNGDGTLSPDEERSYLIRQPAGRYQEVGAGSALEISGTVNTFMVPNQDISYDNFEQYHRIELWEDGEFVGVISETGKTTEELQPEVPQENNVDVQLYSESAYQNPGSGSIAFSGRFTGMEGGESIEKLSAEDLDRDVQSVKVHKDGYTVALYAEENIGVGSGVVRIAGNSTSIGFDNAVSSIHVQDGCTATLYQHQTYSREGGECIKCTADACTKWTNTCSSEGKTFSDAPEDLTNIPFGMAPNDDWSNRASAIEFDDSSCTATLYKTTGFDGSGTGNKLVVTGTTTRLGMKDVPRSAAVYPR